MFRQTTVVAALDRLDNARVELSPPVLKQAAVSHFLRQRMFEGVFEVREQARLVQELGECDVELLGIGLEPGQVPHRVARRRRFHVTHAGPQSVPGIHTQPSYRSYSQLP